MKNNFKLPHFPDSSFELDTNALTGKSKLFQDGNVVVRSTERGKPFLLKTTDDNILKAFPKNGLPDLVPTLEINGKKYAVVQKLQWYEYTIGAFPIFLLFIGGAIGGFIGFLGVFFNYNIFRGTDKLVLKYIKVFGITFLSYLIFYIISYFLISQLQ